MISEVDLRDWIPPEVDPGKPYKTALETQVAGDHYKKNKIQPIEYIYANGLDYSEGAVVKYITRWRSKGGLQDLLKIKHYVDLIIQMEKLDAK